MRARIQILALGAMLGLSVLSPGAVVSSAAAAPARMVRVRVEGIARTGQLVKLRFATITSANGPPVFVVGSQAVSIRPGRYWVGAEVDAPRPNPSETLVLRSVRITRSETVLLDARPGKLVRFTLNVPGAADQTDMVKACVGGSTDGGTSASGAPGTVYAVPVRSRIITFGFGSFWQGTSAGYLIAGHRRGGVPSTPRFGGALSAMARVSLEWRQGTNLDDVTNPNPIMASNGPCGTGWFNLDLFAGSASAITDYITGGRWAFQIFGSGPASWSQNLRFAAGRRYARVFGGSVWGPSAQYAPQTQIHRILFWPAAPFADPSQRDGFYCCDKSSITLSFGGHVIKHEVLTSDAEGLFIARAARVGWYTMAIRSWRSIPRVVIPAGLLSRTETVNWRFFARPTPQANPNDNQLELPVRVAQIVALGLNPDNQAAANGTTPLRIRFVEPHGRGFPRAPRYLVRTARLLASFDGGKSWQAVPLTRHGSFWLATVHDPASGFVALRSIVTDSRGDRSEQTIYQAYAIG